MLSAKEARTSVYYTRLQPVHCCFTVMYASRSWAAHVDGRWVSLSFVSIIAYRSSSNHICLLVRSSWHGHVALPALFDIISMSLVSIYGCLPLSTGRPTAARPHTPTVPLSLR